MTPRQFKWRMNRVLDKAMGAIIDAERCTYKARAAVARAEEAEALAHNAYQGCIEAAQVLAADVRKDGEPAGDDLDGGGSV